MCHIIGENLHKFRGLGTTREFSPQNFGYCTPRNGVIAFSMLLIGRQGKGSKLLLRMHGQKSNVISRVVIVNTRIARMRFQGLVNDQEVVMKLLQSF